MFDCKVLTLPRTPDRLDAFIAHNRRVAFELQVCYAVDGNQINRRELFEAGLITADADWTLGAIGNALSHRSLWKQAEQSGQPLIVLEDDAVVAPGLHDCLEQILPRLDLMTAPWDILLLGYNTDSAVDLQLSPGMSFRGHFSLKNPTPEQIQEVLGRPGDCAAHRLNNAFGTCGYVVSPAGARRLLNWCFPLRDEQFLVPSLKRMLVASSIDGLMNAIYPQLSAHCCVPPLVLSSNRPEQSTVCAGRPIA